MVKSLCIAVDGRELANGGLTGIGRYLRGMLQAAVTADSTLRIKVIGASNDMNFPEGVEVIPLLHGPTIWQDHWELPRLARELRASVFFSPYPKIPIDLAIPRIAAIHDLIFLHARTAASRFTADAYNLAVCWASCRYADRILTVSRFSAADIANSLGANPSKLEVIYPGVDEAFFERPSEPPCGHLPSELRPDGYVLYVGNGKPHKNIPALIAAYAALPEQLQRRYALALVGVTLQEQKALAERLSVREGKVLFCRPAADDLLPFLYRNARLFATASRREGFGFPVVEAMAAGIPVVCSNRASLPEVAGDAALLVEPDNIPQLSEALYSGLTDEALRATLIERGMARARRFSWQEAGKRFAEVLRAVVP